MNLESASGLADLGNTLLQQPHGSALHGLGKVLAEVVHTNDITPAQIEIDDTHRLFLRVTKGQHALRLRQLRTLFLRYGEQYGYLALVDQLAVDEKQYPDCILVRVLLVPRIGLATVLAHAH